jgi:murein L,D-transpeptidase YcbB/YkuD
MTGFRGISAILFRRAAPHIRKRRLIALVGQPKGSGATMKKLTACLLTALALASGPVAATAQETVFVNGVEATRVVIGPARTELARIIKAGLSENYYRANRDTRSYEEAQKLYFFYGSRNFEPLWLTEDATGAISFSSNAQEIIEVFEEAHLEGLDPHDYLTDDIDLFNIGEDPIHLAALETAFSAAAVRYAQDAFGGRINPRQVSGYITIAQRRINESETLMQLAASEHPGDILKALSPNHREFVALRAALAKFYDGTAEDPLVVPDGTMLRPGRTDARVPVLRERLGVTAPDLPSNVYDEILVAAVESFQESLGLTVDGVIGPATVAALNGGNATSRADIIANMERWRWMPEDLGDFYVHVNIPEYRLAIMRDDAPVYGTRIVVGKRSNQTPIFSDEIEHIVVNPYWNVPSSIARNEIGPQLASNPGYIANHNMELLSGGRVVNASAVDWSTTSINNFRIRQRPGSSNALGSVKFLFPNQHDVYLHDTPSKSLFSRSQRAFSHGCVRVQNPWEFAAALLQQEPTITLASLESQRGSGERWNNLDRHIPVHITYFTLRVDENGNIHSYSDVYGHNARIKELLHLF